MALNKTCQTLRDFYYSGFLRVVVLHVHSTWRGFNPNFDSAHFLLKNERLQELTLSDNGSAYPQSGSYTIKIFMIFFCLPNHM